MNSPSLYRSHGRWMFWIAFVCAIGIHLGAVVLAKARSERVTHENFTLSESDVELIKSEPNPISAEDLVTPPPLDQVRPDQEIFSEEKLKEPKVRPRKRVQSAALTTGTTALLRSTKAMVMYAPRPIYPYEARRLRITGSGTVLLTIDSASGNVTDVIMLQSCGNAILDIVTVDVFRRWRFRPGTAVKVQVPITYTLMGASY